jgi:uncharacterized protein (DUF3084 family)
MSPEAWIQIALQAGAVAALVYIVNKSSTGDIRWGKTTLEQIQQLVDRITQLTKDLDEERKRHTEDVQAERIRCKELLDQARRDREADVTALTIQRDNLWADLQKLLIVANESVHTAKRLTDLVGEAPKDSTSR